MFSQRDAIIHLLDDDDAETVALVKRKLVEGGSGAIGHLEELLTHQVGERVERHVRAVMASIRFEHGSAEFGQLCANFEHDGDIEAASWLLARTLLPATDLAPFQEQLDIWGARAAAPLARARSTTTRVEVLAELLGDKVGLRGNTEDYYRLENSLLPTVIHSRRGLPISLSLIYMLVGRRAGLSVEGVGLPGYFIARHEDVLFDPFAGGRILTVADCATLLERQNLRLVPEHLRTCAARPLLVRVLTNLRHVVRENDPPLLSRIDGWIAALGDNGGAPVRVELINTGTELLLGHVINSHLPDLARMLFPLGLRVERQVTVPDGPAMRSAMSEAFPRAEIVIVTGGLGPTSDDITREVTAELLGLDMSADAQVLAAIERRFARRNIALNDNVRKQAQVPRGAVVLPNDHGTAPGLYFPGRTPDVPLTFSSFPARPRNFVR